MLLRTQRYLTNLWLALLDQLMRSATALRARLRVLAGTLRYANLIDALRGRLETLIRRGRSARWPRQLVASCRRVVLAPLASRVGAISDRLARSIREDWPRWTRGLLALLRALDRESRRVAASWTHSVLSLRVSPLAALTSIMNAMGTCLVLLVMFVILTDVIGRTLFQVPLRGTAEIVAMSIAAIVFLQFPSTLRAGRVIQTDGLLEWVGARSVRTEQYLLAGYHVLGGVMFAIVCAFVAPMLRTVVEGREFYGNVGVFTFPKWPVFTVIAFGTAVMAIQYFVLAIEYARAGQQGRRLTEVDPATRVMS